MMKAVIMAGGLGTRIASVAKDVPKPMIRINGKPVLQYQIENLRSNGIKDITIVTGHLGHVIKDYFCDGSSFGVSIKYFTEDIPHGTAGALFYMANLDEDFLLILGDILFDVDFDHFIHFHKKSNALATVIAHPNSHNNDCAVLVTKENVSSAANFAVTDTHIIKNWLSTDDERGTVRNLVNCGVHIIKPELIGMAKKAFVPLRLDNPKFVDLDRNILKPFTHTGRIIAYNTSEYLKDMGTPLRLEECEADIKNGMFAGRSFSRIKKAVYIKKCLVTDNIENSLSCGVLSAIRIINASPYLLQGYVLQTGNSSKLYQQDLKSDSILSDRGVFFDDVYYKRGFEFVSRNRNNIDLNESYFIYSCDEDLNDVDFSLFKKCVKLDSDYTLMNFVIDFIKSS